MFTQNAPLPRGVHHLYHSTLSTTQYPHCLISLRYQIHNSPASHLAVPFSSRTIGAPFSSQVRNVSLLTPKRLAMVRRPTRISTGRNRYFVFCSIYTPSFVRRQVVGCTLTQGFDGGSPETHQSIIRASPETP